jgi:hypothetical protein
VGCDIHTTAQRLEGGKYIDISGLRPFDNRDYGVFGFLANVRNYSHVPPLAAPRGYPEDYRVELDWDKHSASWLLVSELTIFDYDRTFEDRRCMKQTGPNSWDGSADAGEGNGKIVTYREFLGPSFFKDLAELVREGAQRIVFDFNS